MARRSRIARIAGWTWQIGDGAALAAACGIDTVADFRSADVAAGGQGAPLIPVYHAALVANLAKPVAVLNLGAGRHTSFIGATARWSPSTPGRQWADRRLGGGDDRRALRRGRRAGGEWPGR